MENKHGSGIFLGVVSVATLVVAIIGATFAFFSASGNVTGGNNVITGGTNNDLSTALSATVEKVTFTFSGQNGDIQPASNNLVPTNLSTSSDITHVGNAVTAKCVDGGYTGCHLYRIKATSTQTISEAHLNLATLTNTNVADAADWQYIIFTGASADTGATVTPGTLVANGANTFPTFASTYTGTDPVSGDPRTGFDMHGGSGMTQNTNYVYYLLIFLHDDSASQNQGGSNDSTGSYNGTVTLTAAGGGQVTATFSAS